jgi:hypothetical protein
MITTDNVREIAMALPGTEEMDHFGMPSFRVKNKIFATLWVKEKRMMVKLSPIDQSVFNSFNPAIFYPVPNKWGQKGATFIELTTVRPDMLQDAITTAWKEIFSIKEKM